MALLFMDGFDHYAITADLSKKGWTANLASIAQSSGRRGGGAVSLANGYSVSKSVAPLSTIIIGFAITIGGGASAYPLVKLSDSTPTVHLTLKVNGDNTISVYRGDGSVILGTTTSQIVPGIFHYIEIKATISDTVGVVVLRINGTTALNLTGIDTKNAGSFSSISTVSFNYFKDTNSLYDDFYICDTTGPSPCNDFLGDVRIDTLFPNADGTYSAFTPSTGTSHFALVDETAPNTTDYNSGSGIGDRDSYGLTNLTPLVSQTIYGVQVNAAVLKDDAGSKSAAPFIRSGSTNADGTAASLGTSQVYIRQIAELDPNVTIAWTESAINAMEAGVVVTA